MIRTLNVLALVLAIFSSARVMASSQLQWLEGVKDLNQRAQSETTEFSRFYFQFFRGAKSSQSWGSLTLGDEWRAYPDFREAGQIIDQIIKVRPQEVRGCVLHTHPRKAVLALQTLSADELTARGLSGLESLGENGLIIAPPGEGDTSIELGLAEPFADAGQSPRIESAMGVVDSLGVWYWDYFKQKSDQDHFVRSLGYSQRQIKDMKTQFSTLNKVRVPFMIEVSRRRLSASAVTQLESYRRLLAGYAFHGVKLRFVALSDLANEPACAGVSGRANLDRSAKIIK